MAHYNNAMDPWDEYRAALEKAHAEYNVDFWLYYAPSAAGEKLDAAKREAWQRYQLALELAESPHDAKAR